MPQTLEHRVRKWVHDELGNVSVWHPVSIHIDDLLEEAGSRTALLEQAVAAYKILVRLLESRGLPVEPVLIIPLVTKKRKQARAVPRDWEAAKKELDLEPPGLYMIDWKAPHCMSEEYRRLLQIAPVPGLPSDANVYYRECRDLRYMEIDPEFSRNLYVEYSPWFTGITREKRKLHRAFLDFMELPFPPDSRDQELRELHAELAGYEGFVAGSIDTLLSVGHFPRLNVQQGIDMEKRLARIIASGDEKRGKQAKVYADYLHALHRLVNLAREIL